MTKTADHLTDSAAIAFCGINTDYVPHGLLLAWKEIAGFVSLELTGLIKKLIGSWLNKQLPILV